jgi:hypothetical protein
MGARSKQPPRSRREERPAKLQPEAGRVSSKGGDSRAKRTKAERRSERAAARLDAIERNASSIPPAAMHAVFDVSLPPPARSPSSSLPPPPPRGDRRKADRHASHKPPPHPPRPSNPPAAERARTPPPPAAEAIPESGVELSPNEYEFASDSFGIPPLTAPRTDAPVELRVELPPERFDEQRPARIPYRAIALASAASMVLVIVAGVTRPKEQKPTAAHATQKPLAAAFAEAAGKASAIAPAPASDEVASAEPAASTEDLPTAAASIPAVTSNVVVAEPEAGVPSAGAAAARSPAPAFRSGSRADAGVAAAAFDTALASSSITAAFARASSCLKDGDPRQPATILLTYAPSGRVTTAVLSGPYSGTAVGGCIAATLRTARVPPFSGDYVTVKRTSVLK